MVLRCSSVALFARKNSTMSLLKVAEKRFELKSGKEQKKKDEERVYEKFAPLDVQYLAN